MKAVEANLLSFLKKSPQFVIPIYQRTYSWTERECRQLWDDILRTGNDPSIAAHFVGSIVYIEQGLYQVSSQSPLLEEGGIEAFLRREVLPHAADAWYVPTSVKTGYEISFTRYFYKPQPLRTLEEIRADILALEKETEGLLGEIVGTGGNAR